MRLTLLLMVCLVAVGAYAVVIKAETSALVAPPSLAERIEAACTKPGYSATDWTVGDEWNPVPEGLVKVTCTHGTNYSSYRTVVAR